MNKTLDKAIEAINESSDIITYTKKTYINYLIIYLFLLAIILEILHLIIPERSFQWSDLFGNLLAVFIVFFINNLINKYEVFKK